MLLAHEILYIAGPLCFLLMQLSVVNTAVIIYSHKSTLQYSCLPLLALFTNCCLWTIYSIIIEDMTLFYPNVSGMVIGYLTTIIYQIYSKDGIPLLYTMISLGIIAIAIILGLNMNYEDIGIMGVCLSVALMGSPLATIQLVFQNKSTESMPFPMCLMTWFNALSWSLYGIIITNNPFVYIPNLLGLCLCSFQLSLFVFYGFHDENESFNR